MQRSTLDYFCGHDPALVISYVISTLFQDTQYQGLNALAHFNTFVFRIAVASFFAYVFGQLLDVLVFNRLRQLKTWWIAPSSSMILVLWQTHSSSLQSHFMPAVTRLWRSIGRH